MGETILLIENEKNLIDIFSDELEYRGFRVMSATSGKEAFKKVENKMPDLIILDIKLPDVTGTEILAYIRSYNQQVPIIICTAIPLPKLKTYYERWANGVMTKPIDLDTLVSKVNEKLSNVRYG